MESVTDAPSPLSTSAPRRERLRADASYTETSFREFFEIEAPSLFQRLFLVTGNTHEAEDVMQDAFLKVYERWAHVRTLVDPVGYLYRTAFNTFKSRARRTALAAKRTFRPERQTDEFEAADTRNLIDAALARLTPRQRAAVVLTDLLGYDSAEAGHILGIRPGTVRALSFQAREAMRRTVGADDG